MVMRCENLEPHEERMVEAHSRLPAPLVYEVIRRDGIEEMRRPFWSLTWSGIAAGMFIALSVISEAMFRVHLPDTPWRPLVENLGYSVGFIAVIMGRMQLFTENTVTTVLPTATSPTWANLWASARVWMIVFGANLIGAVISAGFLVWGKAFPPEVLLAVADISKHALDPTAIEIFITAIPAGFLIAAVVWMLPSSEGASFWVILLFTYLIALGEFSHVVAGSVEMFYLVLSGEKELLAGVTQFLIPAFCGNVFGGTAVFALLAYGQVSNEMPEELEHQDVVEESSGRRSGPKVREGAVKEDTGRRGSEVGPGAAPAE